MRLIKAKEKSGTRAFYLNPVNRKLPVGEDEGDTGKSWIARGAGTPSLILGVADDAANRPADDPKDLKIIPSFIQLTAEGLPKVDTVKEVSPAIYEDRGPQVVTVDITLKAAAPKGGTTVSVRVLEIDGEEKRDTDYVARVDDSAVVVEEGKKTVQATITVTPEDNDKKNTWAFNVEATVPGVSAPAPAKLSIVDDEADISAIRLRATIGDSDCRQRKTRNE